MKAAIKLMESSWWGFVFGGLAGDKRRILLNFLMCRRVDGAAGSGSLIESVHVRLMSGRGGCRGADGVGELVFAAAGGAATG